MTRPTIVEVWSPRCHECRAMRPDLEAVGAEFSDRVVLTGVNAMTEPDAARTLGVKGTPTIIGFRAGREQFRVTGRRSRADLRLLFESVATGSAPTGIDRSRLVLGVGAGTLLAASGLALAEWGLVAIGIATTGYGVGPLLRKTR